MLILLLYINNYFYQYFDYKLSLLMKIKYLLMLVEARAFLHALKCNQNVNKAGRRRSFTCNEILGNSIKTL